MLGTDIWAANTFDSFSGATWDLQPEKLDFTQFHRKLRNTSKHPLPHIDREGLGKGKYEDGDSINLNDIEKVLPVWQVGDKDICPCHSGDQQQRLPCLVFP
ncbi:PREDICTED: CBP80/20-dependent translation initiation factor [Corvus brachyrhynchos]|uniref:CBP80/20-dependent translation initiation factor n=1 Tax=Corvus brachyrhynchos TaxID=85066 RepID=UPI0008165926|nr:PREDICTED: CBP80/20-dependent translation initiation factor [Corvus brachyrhynchos]